jgi:hypothetical protein
MKKLIQNNPRGLTAAIAVLACFTGAAHATVEENKGTNAIAFSEQRGDRSANLADAQQGQFNDSTQYITPLSRALELKNELSAGAPTPNAVFENNTSYTKLTDKRSCFQASLTYDVKNFSSGTPRPIPLLPKLEVNIADLKGKLGLTGQYCRDGKWNGNAIASLNCKFEAFYGVSSGDWRKYNYGTRRFRFTFGIKGESNINTDVQFGFNGTGWSYQYAKIRLGIGGDLTLSILSPRLEVQQLSWDKKTWLAFHDGPVWQGTYVEGAEFKFDVYGRVSMNGWYTYEVWDNDPDKKADSERHRVNATASGDFGVKVKVKIAGHSTDYHIRYAFQKELLDSGKHHKYADASISEKVDDVTDHEMSRRP